MAPALSFLPKQGAGPAGAAYTYSWCLGLCQPAEWLASLTRQQGADGQQGLLWRACEGHLEKRKLVRRLERKVLVNNSNPLILQYAVSRKKPGQPASGADGKTIASFTAHRIHTVTLLGGQLSGGQEPPDSTTPPARLLLTARCESGEADSQSAESPSPETAGWTRVLWAHRLPAAPLALQLPFVPLG